MLKLLWALAILSIPLLMVRGFSLFEIPLTHVFVFSAGLFKFKSIFSRKLLSIEKLFASLFLIIIVIFIIDLNRSIDLNENILLLLKAIMLLVSIRIYSFFISYYKLSFFFRMLSLGSILILSAIIYRSIFIYHAPYLVVNPIQISEVGKNQTAFYLALIFPMLFWYMLKAESSKYWKLFIQIILALHLFAIVYIQSKGLLFSLVLSFFLSILFFRNQSFKFKTILRWSILILVPITIIGTFNFIDFSSFSEDITSLFSDKVHASNSSNERIELLEKGTNYFLDNPIFGIGTNNFVGLEKKATHNNYLQLLAENGFFIFTLFLLVFLLILRKTKVLHKLNNKTMICITSLITMLMYLFVINGLFTPIVFIVFSLIVFFENEFKIEKIK